jgi:hypothetical protein
MGIRAKRKLNGKKFAAWDDLPDDGRRYFLEVTGR